MKDRWTAVDRYLADRLLPRDAALEAALEASQRAGLPAIQVSACQGKLLELLAAMCGAKSILEIGTLGGYSTIWLARALPRDGRVITIEADPKHAEVARENIARARLDGRVEIKVGPALKVLPELEGQRFDFVFIDADKPNNLAYVDWALWLSRPGTVIVVDNVIRDGAVVDAHSSDPSVVGVREMNEFVRAEPRLSATTIQTVGEKGYDGFLVARVVGP
jgi:predicted O-methyltransferase YrrM